MPTNKIDPIDLRILRELQQSGKLSNVDLAGRVGLSPSPCLSRVRSLEQRGIIDRYVALVRPSSVGLLINVFIQVTEGGDPKPNLGDPTLPFLIACTVKAASYAVIVHSYLCHRLVALITNPTGYTRGDALFNH